MTLCQQLARTGLFVCGIALVLCSVFPATTAAHEEDCILGHDTEHYGIDDQLLQARSGRDWEPSAPPRPPVSSEPSSEATSTSGT